MKIYVASKTCHAPLWRNLRDNHGWRIISTWIDEAEVGETKDFADLWDRCITEASSCDRLVIYRQPEEVLKGAWVELGAALAKGVGVYAVGIEEFSVSNHEEIICLPHLLAVYKRIKKIEGMVDFCG